MTTKKKTTHTKTAKGSASRHAPTVIWVTSGERLADDAYQQHVIDTGLSPEASSWSVSVRLDQLSLETRQGLRTMFGGALPCRDGGQIAVAMKDVPVLSSRPQTTEQKVAFFTSLVTPAAAS